VSWGSLVVRGVYRYLLEPMPCSRDEILDFLARARREAEIAASITKWLTIGLIVVAWVVFVGVAKYMFSTGPLVAALASLIAFIFGYWGYRNYRDFYRFVDRLYSMVERGMVNPRILCKQQLGFMSNEDLDDLAKLAQLSSRGD